MASELRLNILENPLPILLGGFGGGLGIAGMYFLREKYLDCKERKELNIRRNTRQQARTEHFTLLEEEYKLGKEQRDIVALPFNELVRKLQARELTSRRVLEAFVAKSIVISKEFNCVTEFAPNMFELADQLDALPAVKGAFHGVPFCVKDDHDVEGMDTTLGYTKDLDNPANENCAIVQILLDAGAIPFCKTNVPQTLFSYACHNPIYGTTYNHLNKLLGPGGSSGGTACLVGAGGAAFGTGSDIGGSVRIPAHFSGISTLKPTAARVSDKGVRPCVELCAGLVGVSGIVAPTATTLASVYKVMTADAIQNVYDPLTVPLPWNEKVYQSKAPLRIGYYMSLPFFPALGDTPQTVLRAKQALEAFGHTLVPFELPDTFNIMNVFTSLAGADAGEQIYKQLKNDEISYVADKFTLGRTVRSKLSFTLKYLFNNKSPRAFSSDLNSTNSQVLWTYLAQQKAIKYEVMSLMKNLELDLILCPTFPFPATRLKDGETLMSAILYTCVWNLLDFPAGSVPFGMESGQKIHTYDDQDDFYLKLAKEGIESAVGMPIGVQVVGKPFQEEMVLRIMTQLDRVNN